MSDPQTTRDVARDAKELLESKVFLQAVSDLRKEWFGQLMDKSTGEPESEIVSKLRALNAIPIRLQHYINNAKMLEKR